MVEPARCDAEIRLDVVRAALAITAKSRVVPNHICLTCLAHVYVEQHPSDHDVASLTLAERNDVARLHKEVSDEAWAAMSKQYRRL